jgi:hypothetical protein
MMESRLVGLRVWFIWAVAWLSIDPFEPQTATQTHTHLETLAGGLLELADPHERQLRRAERRGERTPEWAVDGGLVGLLNGERVLQPVLAESANAGSGV